MGGSDKSECCGRREKGSLVCVTCVLGRSQEGGEWAGGRRVRAGVM